MKPRSDILVLQPEALQKASGRTKARVDDTIDTVDFEKRLRNERDICRIDLREPQREIDRGSSQKA
jgi:hypothetical protein